jgi:hypothetical protein
MLYNTLQCLVGALLWQFPLQKVAKEPIDYVIVVLRVNGVFEENGHNNPMIRVTGSSMDCMGIFCRPFASILRVHINCEVESRLI